MNNEFLKRIERYLNHEMNAREVEAFESDLQCDPDLARDYNIHMDMLRAIKDKEVIELRKKLGDIIGNTDIPGLEESRGRYFMKWFWLAATITLLFSIASVSSEFFFDNPDPLFYVERLLDNNWQEREAYQLPTVYAGLLHDRKHEEDFRITYPADSAIISIYRYVVFKWINTWGSSIYIEIFDRKGNLQYSSPHPAHSPDVIKVDFPRGVYLYRFKTKNEILCHGVFFVH